MKPVRSIEDLAAWQAELAARPAPQTTLRVCSTGCRALGALDVCEALEQAVSGQGLTGRVRVVRTGCHGLCSGAVTMRIDPPGLFYQKVCPEDAAEIFSTTVLGGKVIRRLCWSGGGKRVALQDDIPFYRLQNRLVLRNCGQTDPMDIEDAVANGAYRTAAEVLRSKSPEEVIAAVSASGLRGRGGAGFPTGRKWQFARSAAGGPKYVISNADEGDPGAFMDRAVLEGDPHLGIEGMILGAYAIGASRGYYYIREEYPLAIEITRRAVTQAQEAGLLGTNILGSGLDFDIEVVAGAGSYVCGEETALIASIEGKRGHPRARPPFPANQGLFGKPTNTNNVETWANVPRVFQVGPEAYAELGTATSKGTKIFSLSGSVRHTGLVEVPMGATLRQIIYDIGGGLPAGRKFKAALVGGPCGGLVPDQSLDLPIDYETLKPVGAMMGCGGIIVLDDRACMVDMARDAAQFARSESCGKCVPCRVGNNQLGTVLDRVAGGQGRIEDIDLVEQLAAMIDRTSLCGMAPNPVRSTVRYFRQEYEEHVRLGRCRLGVCQTLSPRAGALSGESGSAHV